MTGATPPRTRFTVLTLFPEIVRAYTAEGVIGRAVRRGLVAVEPLDLRPFGEGRYQALDDVPFGGGAGMVMKPEPLARAIEAAGPASWRVVLSASGRPFRQADAERFAELEHVVLLCGRYEGVDARVADRYMDDAVSIGDYVLSGGELAALVVLDATLRLVPGVLGNAESLREESYQAGGLEHPHFTRPATWRGDAVPEVLLSGHHGRVAAWRRQEARRRTAALRPDLLAGDPGPDTVPGSRPGRSEES
ncbi:MAG: tRNA (guanosine(37)-N1)-methyltransferase TrmD [Myxococcales bacterium]|nr:tRNA (guanosine(37)-N1)-methyltransferase TrmD [Myxococcales bacterium]MCB9545113.1 tRNA (guanosine(37)-N1)-methyltransferase TrmD [Myxococcales bacterium]